MDDLSVEQIDNLLESDDDTHRTWVVAYGLNYGIEAMQDCIKEYQKLSTAVSVIFKDGTFLTHKEIKYLKEVAL